MQGNKDVLALRACAKARQRWVELSLDIHLRNRGATEVDLIVNWIALRRSYVIINCRNEMLPYRQESSLEGHRRTFVLRHTTII